MNQRILIFYLHEDFIKKLLIKLYPKNFNLYDNFPLHHAELLLLDGEKTVEIITFLGLKSEYQAYCPNEIYIEQDLITDETQDLITKMKEKMKVSILSLRNI